MALRVVNAFHNDHPPATLDSYVSSLPPAAFAKLLQALVSPPPQFSALTLLRALWCCRSHRVAVLTTTATAASLHNLAAARALITEAELLLAADARDATGSRTDRLRAVTAYASSLVRHATHEPCAYHAQLLVACARAAAQIPTRRAANVERRIMTRVVDVFASPDHPHAATALIAVLDSDIPLQPATSRTLARHVEGFIAAAEGLVLNDVPAIFRSVLNALAHTTSPDDRATWARIVCRMVSFASSHVFADVLLVLEVGVADHDWIAADILDVYEAALGQPSEPRTERRATRDTPRIARKRISAADVVFLFALLRSAVSERIRRRTFGALESIVRSEFVEFDLSRAASSSSSSVDKATDFARRTVLVGSLSMPGAESRCDVIVEVCEQLVWSLHRSSQDWGVKLLVEVFNRHPRARQHVLVCLFSALAEGSAPSHVHALFCQLLERLTAQDTAAVALRDHTSTLEYWLGYISTMACHVACRIVSALASVAVGIPMLCDSLVVLMRKMASSRACHSRSIAASGLVALLAQATVPDDVAIDVSDAVVVLMGSATIDLRAHVVSLLIGLLREVMADQKRRLWRIHSAVLARLQGLCGEAVVGIIEMCPLRLESCFELSCGELVVKDAVPTLVMYIVELRDTVPQADELFRSIVAYVCDSGRALRDACSAELTGEKSHIAELPSAKVELLLALCEILLSVQGLVDMHAVLRVYAIALVIRDSIPAKNRYSGVVDGGLFKSPGSGGGSGNSFGLSAVSAREAASVASVSGSAQFAKVVGALSCARCLSILERLEAGLLLHDKYAVMVVRTELFRLILARVSECDTNETSSLRRRIHAVASNAYIDTNPWKTLVPDARMGTVSDRRSCRREDIDMPDPDMPDFVTKDGGSFVGPALAEARSSTSDCDQPCADASEILAEPVEDEEHHSCGLEGVPECIAHAETRIAFEDKVRGDKDSERLRLSTRCLALRLLFVIVQPLFVTPDWLFLVRSAEDAGREEDTVLADARTSQSYEESETSKQRGGGKELTLLDNDLPSAAQSLCRLLRVLELEFDHSLSTELTLVYIELLTWFIDDARQFKSSVRSEMRRSIAASLWNLLKVYSIAQVRVLRPLLGLLLSSFDPVEAFQFVWELFSWLGSEAGMLDNEPEDQRVCVPDSDSDVAMEALVMDGVLPGAESAAGSVGVDNVQTPVDAQRGARHPNEDTDEAGHEAMGSIRDLSLNETNECGLTSVLCGISYLEASISTQLSKTSDFALHAGSWTHDALAAIRGITGAAVQLLHTQLPRSQDLAWPDVLRKRVISVVCGLYKVCGNSLRYLRSIQGIESLYDSASCRNASKAAAIIIESLLASAGSRAVISALAAGDSTTKVGYQGEMLELSIATTLSTKRHVTSVERAPFKVVFEAYTKVVKLQSLNKAEDGAKASITDEEPINAARLSKRRRVRSRNKVVDGWLREETGADNYVDLEEFVVGLDEEL